MTTGHLGNLTVRRVGYGAMQLAGPGVFGPPADPENSRKVLRRAVELGVDHIDTAQFYGPDVVNDLIREALHPYPEPLRLVTKVGARRDEKGGFVPAGEPDQLVEQVEENLRALGTEQLALVNLRRYELDAPGSEEPALEDQLAALMKLRKQGKVAEIGISSVPAPTALRAVELAGVVSVQNPYSILDRSGQDVLEVARENSLAFVPYFPLGSAFTGGPEKIAADPHISAVAQKHGVAPTQIALAWLLAQYENVLLIPGTSSIAHLEDNLAVDGIDLDPEDLAQLAKVEESAAGH
jgi:aryl-alcohol dehydrogenase-like predicted oxidoreductase